METNSKKISQRKNDKGNVKIEIKNCSAFKNASAFFINSSMKLKLNKLWKELDCKTDGLLEIIYSSDNGLHILVNCGNIIWTVYKRLVIMKKGNKITYRYDQYEKFQNEIIHSIPLNKFIT
jgi:hypothetical protein